MNVGWVSCNAKTCDHNFNGWCHAKTITISEKKKCLNYTPKIDRNNIDKFFKDKPSLVNKFLHRKRMVKK